MKTINKIKLTAAIVTLVVTGIAHAQVVSLGATAGGAIRQVGASVASVVSNNSDIQMRPRNMSGSQQYLDAVNSGRLQFGICNIMQYYMAVKGIGLSKGEPKDNLRLVATLMPFIQGVIVRTDSGIDSIAELKGKRIPQGYASSPLFQTFWQAFLANAGLSYDDVQGVPVASLPKSWKAFKEGRVDAVIAAAGSAPVREMDASISGGVEYLPINSSPELLGALPGTRIERVAPQSKMYGVSQPTSMHVYEMVLFANANVDDATVHEVAAAIHNNETALRASTPLWKTYRPNQIAMDHELAYHPAAKKYFRSQGLWHH